MAKRKETRNDIVNRFERVILAPVNEQLRRTPDDANGYIARHRKAWTMGYGFECCIVRQIYYLAMYAAEYESKFESKLASDYVLGEYWADMVRGVRGLLNGPTGGLDAGFCDAEICNIWREAGFTEDL